MIKRYKLVRIPEEAYYGFKNKNQVIESILKDEKIKKRFTMADTFRYFSQKKIFIYNDEVLSFLNNKKAKHIGGTII